MRVPLLSLCASLSTVLKKNSYNVPLVSLGLLVDSAENWYLYSLFCVPMRGALLQGGLWDSAVNHFHCREISSSVCFGLGFLCGGLVFLN